jgi:hypothetical protein
MLWRTSVYGLRLLPDGGVEIAVGLDLMEAFALAGLLVVLLLVVVGGHAELVWP